MKRGFLNDGRYKKTIDETNASVPSPGEAKTPRQGKAPSPGGAPHNGDGAPCRDRDKVDVKMKGKQNGYPEGHAQAVRTKTSKGDMKRGFLNDGRYKKAIDETYSDGTGDRDGMKGAQNGSPGGHGARVAQTKASESCDGVDSTKTENEPHAKAKDPKGKGKAKVVDVDEDDTALDDDGMTIPPRPPPRRPGWGCGPQEAFFHRVPESREGRYVKRAVFRLWPRDPNGAVLMPPTNGKLRGKASPDGYPWFETLYDVYYVNRVPSIPNAMAIVPGSALSEHMKTLGELDAAAPEIEWAKSEGQPRVEAVANTEELIKCMESRVQLTSRYGFEVRAMEMDYTGEEEDEQDKQDGDDEQDEGDEERDEQDEEDEEEQVSDEADDAVAPYIPPAPVIPVASHFHASHYPDPWPVTPFEKTFPVLLQERIPLYLLPKCLYVHDPFGLLTARKRKFRNTSWTSRPDIVWTYKLHLSSSVYSQIEKAKQKAEEMEEFKARTLIILRYQRTEEQIKNYEPVIEVPLPPYMRRPTKVEESHLYLSPVARVGEGNHSIVYKGEWELPRDIFAKPNICPACFKDSADKEIQRLKDSGRWEKMLKARSWGPKGYTGHQPSQADLDGVCDPPKNDGEIIEREITCVVWPNMAPSRVVELIEESDIWDTLKKQSKTKSMLVCLVPDSEKDSKVPIMRINPAVSYESQKPCTHNASALSGRGGPVPRTAKFTIVAKLSIEDDPHLVREARNYQQFPEHLFDHYNGYIIVSQLKSFVPVGAVVPQFYGYYKPERGRELRREEPSYLSPILLLEHCGTPVEPQELSLEDQEECASLILRFQQAGWLHESIAPRNFLVQHGKPTEFPLMRAANPELSFRLIDFGRSRKYATAEEKRREEHDAMRMFERLCGKMAVTFSMGH